MSNYILKSEIPSCPPLPDMSKYVLKSSVPPQIQCPPCPDCPPCNCPNPPEIKVCEELLKDKGKDCGVCPPCPRVKCPKPKLECKQVNQNGKYYTDVEINKLVENKNTLNICKNQRIGNNNTCTPQPYESGDFHSPLMNNGLSVSRI